MTRVQPPTPLGATPERPDAEHAARRRLARTTGVAARGYAWIVVSLRLGVIGCWAVLAALAALHLPAFGSSGGPIITLIPPGAPALRTLATSERLFHVPAQAEFAVVVRDPGGLSPAALSEIAAQAVRTDTASGGDVRFAIPITNTARLFPGSRESGTTAITFLDINPALSVQRQGAVAAAYAHSLADSTGMAAHPTGAIPGQLRQGVLIDHWLLLIEVLTLAVILAIIGATYRSIGAPLIVLATATVGLLVTVWGLAQLQSRLGLSVPQALDPVLIALLLGIITDYAVFFLSGTRGRLAGGEAPAVAVRVTTAEFSPIILKSAVILGCGLLGLLVSKLTAFRDLGPALALTVGIAVVVSLTLVPALLATFGRVVFWPRRLPQTSAGAGEVAAPQAAPHVFGRLMARRPVSALMALVCVAGLGFAAWQLQGLRVGFGQISDLPSSAPEHQASVAADRGFAPGILSPTTVLIQGDNAAADQRPSLDALQRSIDRQPGVAATLGPVDEPSPGRFGVFLTRSGGAARIVVVFGNDPLGASGINDLRHLQAVMPSLAERAGLRGVSLSYAGDTVLADQTIAAVRTDMIRVGLAVLVINLLLLIVFLRGLMAPLFLLASSVLTVAATLGLTSWVFQDLLGYGQLTYYVPFAVGVLLVSLGSDYNVFVVGRIWQEVRLRPLREAVAIAAPRASRTIRIAGVALAASFALLAIIPLRSFREIAFAMATGILLETFVVRALLVPALIVLFGRYNVWPSRRFVTPQAPDPAPVPVAGGLNPVPSGYVSPKGGVE